MMLSRLSFRLQLITGCVLVLIATVVPLFIYDVMSEGRKQRHELARFSAHETESLARIVSIPMWDFNDPFLTDMMQSLSEYEEIESAELTDAAGEVLASYTRQPMRAQTAYDVVVERDVIYTEIQNPEVLGTLRIAFSGAPLAKQIKDTALARSGLFVALLLFTSLAIYWALEKLLSPIDRLVESIQKIGTGCLDDDIRDVGRADEIGKVAQALDQLRQSERAMQELRAEQDQHKLQERHRLALALESTEDGVLVLDENDALVLQNDRAVRFFGAFDKGVGIDPALIFSSGSDDGSPNTGSDFTTKVERSGRTYDLRIRMDPIWDEDGRQIGRVVLASDITEQVRQKRRADYLAKHDALTGLPNRRALEAALEDVGSKPVALLFGDLDRFKTINDTMGHATGDALLRHVGDRMRKLVGPDDLPVRLGGDEFALLVHGSDCRTRIEFLGDTLIEAFSVPIQVDDLLLQTSFSLGFACAPDDTENAKDLIQLADLALYQAKNTGRGRICPFEKSLQTDVARRQVIREALSDALNAGQGPNPVYQKQTDAVTGEIRGFEALARWRQKDGTSVSPGEFIPIAEESGLIESVTRRILVESCNLAHDLAHSGFPGRISVNASPILFDGTITSLVAESLDKTGCTPDQLEIEITEQVVLSNRIVATQEIEALRRMGVSVALDDFGMGYSSLSYLQRFPVDKVKIDRAFVVEIARSEETRAIVRAIVDLSGALGMSVTAEGAETEDERRWLTECGVETIQGYVDGTPISEAELRKEFVTGFELLATAKTQGAA
ncbi:MAG: EAL domain-containing protein [Silicimonas sp.]|nr:EAL domain-containing protein [Silicimonas sp.]